MRPPTEAASCDLLGDPLKDIAGVAPEYPVAWSAAKALDDDQELRWLAALVTVRRRFPVRCILRRIGHSNSLALSGNQAEDESSLFSKSATAKFKIGHSGLKPASTRCRRHLYVKPGGCPWLAHVAPSPPRAMSSNARPDYAGALARTRGTNNGRGSRCELGKGPRAPERGSKEFSERPYGEKPEDRPL